MQYSCICNFSIFVKIFLKFSPKCRTKKLGIIYTFGKFLLHYELERGSIFNPKSGLGKSLVPKLNRPKIDFFAHILCLYLGLITRQPVFGDLIKLGLNQPAQLQRFVRILKFS